MRRKGSQSTPDPLRVLARPPLKDGYQRLACAVLLQACKDELRAQAGAEVEEESRAFLCSPTVWHEVAGWSASKFARWYDTLDNASKAKREALRDITGRVASYGGRVSRKRKRQ